MESAKQETWICISCGGQETQLERPPHCTNCQGTQSRTLADYLDMWGKSEEELLELYRLSVAGGVTKHVGMKYLLFPVLLQELAQRQTAKQGDRIEKMTRTMKRLTWLIAGLTVVNTIGVLITVVLTAVK